MENSKLYNSLSGLYEIGRKLNDKLTGCISSISSISNTVGDTTSTGGQSITTIIQEKASMNYTAFEVYANDEAIPSGQSDALNGKVSFEIPSGMTEKFIVRSHKGQDAIDIYVDWGDESDNTKASSLTPTGTSPNNKYLFEHTYKEAR